MSVRSGSPPAPRVRFLPGVGVPPSTGRSGFVLFLPILLIVGGLGVPAGSGKLSPSTPPQGLSLIAAPTLGIAPLLVRFNLTSPNGTPPVVHWSFGDGLYLNGSGAYYDSPAHVYEMAGTFPCLVTAIWPSGSVNASVTIRATPSNLTVSIVARPLSGDAPLTVWFNGTVSGGTGTYIAEYWDFGSGDLGSGLSLRYSYLRPGNYTATLSVTDSANRSSDASVAVTVTNGSHPSGSTSDPNRQPPGPPGWFAPLVIGLLAAGLLVLIGSWVAIRRGRSDPGGPEVTNSPRPRGAAATPPAEPIPEPLDPAGENPFRQAGGADRRDEGPSPPRGSSALQGLTHQMIAHLAGQPRLGPGDVPGASFTQAGIAGAVGAGQSAVSRVLRRLVAAGVVVVETRHVAGSGRRMRVYTLTDRGERLGRALRPAPARTPSIPPPEDSAPGRSPSDPG